ncbi:MAG: ABC transporter permease [Desulfobulbus propionicus]|nr:MAG: ABC transporter permease [Desulfobulbus propionicus]
MTTKNIFLNLYKVVKPYRGKLAIAMIAMVFVAGFNAAQAYMVKPLLDEIFVNKHKALLNILPVVLIVLFFVKGIFYYIYSYVLEWVGKRVIRDLRDKLYSHINTFDMSFFYQHTTGELISRIMNDVDMLESSVSSALVRLFRDIFSAISLLVVIFYLDSGLALIALVFIPVAAIPITKFGKKIRRISHKYQRHMGLSTNQLHETISGVSIVKAFCMEEFEKKRFQETLQQLFEVIICKARYNCLSHPVVEFLGGIGMALIIWYGGMQVLQGSSTPGTFMSFLTALFMLYEPIKGASKLNAAIQTSLAAADRVFTLLNIQPNIRDLKNAEELPSFRESIKFDNVTFNYKNNDPVLHNISFEIKHGEVLAIVGPSGSGKSTLAKLISRFYDVSSGAILVGGKDIRTVTQHSLRKQIALVTQQTILFNDTVRYNIGYGMEQCKEADIVHAATSAYAIDFINELPEKFETVIGESGARLSGGQQQRISIARALLKNAPVLILDEATSSLDTESEKKVQKALENLMQNRTTIVIAHRLSTVKNADRIIVLKEGKIVESGTHDELIAKGDEYTTLYQMQF